MTTVRELHAATAELIAAGQGDKPVLQQEVVDGFTFGYPVGVSFSELERCLWVWRRERRPPLPIYHPLLAHKAFKFMGLHGIARGRPGLPHNFSDHQRCLICGKPETEPEAGDCLLTIEEWQLMLKEDADS
jgi:hypothetical protein